MFIVINIFTEALFSSDDLFDSEDGEASQNDDVVQTSSTTLMNVDSVGKHFPILSPEIQSFDEAMELVDHEENLVETSTSSNVAAVTSTSNHILDFVDEFGSSPVDESSSQTTLNLPTNPQRGQLQEIPRGWIRKVVTTGKGRGQQKVFYYNTMGKKFSCKEDVDQYFGRLGQTVKPGLFNFEPPKISEDEGHLNGTSSSII